MKFSIKDKFPTLSKDDYLQIYRRGYQAGMKNHEWPEHRPPYPPDGIMKEFFMAVRELRDVADYVCSSLDEKDDFVLKLGPKIDEVDNVNIKITQWLKNGEIK